MINTSHIPYTSTWQATFIMLVVRRLPLDIMLMVMIVLMKASVMDAVTVLLVTA